MSSPIVLHLPHASTLIPEDLRNDFLLSDQELFGELVRITDHATDVIFQQAFPEAKAIVFPVSRLVVDPERFSDDSQEPMSQGGMGELTPEDLCVSRYVSSSLKESVKNYWSDITFLITKN